MDKAKRGALHQRRQRNLTAMEIRTTDTLFAQRIVYLPVVVTPAWEVRATEIARMTAGRRRTNEGT